VKTLIGLVIISTMVFSTPIIAGNGSGIVKNLLLPHGGGPLGDHPTGNGTGIIKGAPTKKA
jgi:hypothetical protein